MHSTVLCLFKFAGSVPGSPGSGCPRCVFAEQTEPDDSGGEWTEPPLWSQHH